MSRVKKPPQHQIDAPGIFISETDSSFDKDRFEKESKLMEEAGEDIDSHPVKRYYHGKTRYDLDASDIFMGKEVKIRDYFDFSKDPEKWILRRLDWQQYYKVMSTIHNGQFDQGQISAARWGIAGVENSPLKLKGCKSGELTDADCQLIFDNCNPSFLTSIGFAIWMFSQPLKEDEKKV